MPPIRSYDPDPDDTFSLSSSPPPFVPPSPKRQRVTRATSRAASLEPAASGSNANSRTKTNGAQTAAKGKANAALFPLIELSDSEDDAVGTMPDRKGKAKAKVKTSVKTKTKKKAPLASSSKQKAPELPKPLLNLPDRVPNARKARKMVPTKKTAKKATPLFLASPGPGDDDDEGEGDILGDDERDEEEDNDEEMDPEEAAEMRAFIQHDWDGVGDDEPDMFDDEEPEDQHTAFANAHAQHRHPGNALGNGGVVDDEMDDDMHMAIALSLEESLRKEKAQARLEGFGEGGQAKVNGKGKARALPDDEVNVAGPPNPGPVPPQTPNDAAPPEPELEPLPLDAAPPSSPRTTALIHILEIIPNIQPEYVQGLIETEIAKQVGAVAEAESQQRAGEAAVLPPAVDGIQVAEHLVGVLLEEGGWPKVERGKDKGKAKEKEKPKAKGKRKSDAAGLDLGEGGSKKPRVDWKNRDRPWQGDEGYVDLALIHLQTSFPRVPKAYLRRQLQINNSHYAPTHIALSTEGDDPTRRRLYIPKATFYNAGRDLAKARRQGLQDPILEEERKWIEEWEAEKNGGPVGKTGDTDPEASQAKDHQDIDEQPPEDEDEELADGEGIECQCCFAEYSFAKMVQCPEAHLFCSGCVSRFASTKLGEHNAALDCMHGSGCGQPFPVSELRRVLPAKLMALYDRVKQQKEIEQAGLEGLEECPFCEFKCVIDRSFEEEKLFRCGNEDGGCGVVSCRNCKKEDHLPKSCEEVEQDKHLDGQHAVEEAMTRALMRNCPKCKKPFIKDQGCNKMSCPNCHTLSCYVCRQVISGYDHFDQRQPNEPGPSRTTGKCLLWDSVDQRHADEVKAAAEKAMAKLKESHPDADADKIKVDIPKAPPAPPPPQPMGHAMVQDLHQRMYANVNMANAFRGVAAHGIVPRFGPGFPGYPLVAPVHAGQLNANLDRFNFAQHFQAPVPLPAVVPPARGRRGARQAVAAPVPVPRAMPQLPIMPPVIPPRRGRAAVAAAQPQPQPPPVAQVAQPRHGYAGLYAHDQPPQVLNMNPNLNQAQADEGRQGLGFRNHGRGDGLGGAPVLPDVNAMLQRFLAERPEQQHMDRANQLQNMMRWRHLVFGPGRGMVFDHVDVGQGVANPPNHAARPPIPPLQQPHANELERWLVDRPEQQYFRPEQQMQHMMAWNMLRHQQMFIAHRRW